jgi:rhodanese-related sulfurtransferase
MGWKDVFILPVAGDEIGEPSHKFLCEPPINESIDPAQLSSLLDQKSATVVDLSTSPHYRRGHIPGAWFAIRGRLNLAIEKIDVAGTLILTSEDGVLANLAIEEARAVTKAPVSLLKGGTAAWTAANYRLSTDGRMADEPIDVWLKPYEQARDTEAAMNAYLSWEVDLLDRIEKDGTTHFLHSR